MANISNIDGFIIRGFYAPSTTSAQQDTSEDFTELLNRNFAIGGADPDTAEIINFDFVDGNNDGDLSDSDNEISSQSQSLFTNGDRIVVDGTTQFAVDIGRITVRLHENDGGQIDGAANGFRVYKLNNGDLVLRPLDSQISSWETNGTHQYKWESLEITNVSDNTGINNVTFTTMNAQDDAFPVCFCKGTEIRTEFGTTKIEQLKAGDLVLTVDNGLQPIRWIGSQKLTGKALAANPNLRPIRIRAGALGKGTPKTDLLVSPQHRVLVRSKIAQRMFGTTELLVAAKKLIELGDGINIAEDVSEVEYFHFLFDSHEIVYSNGAETESLYTGPQAMKSIGPEALEEIFTLFPNLRDSANEDALLTARLLGEGKAARKLINRHNRNGQPLIGEDF